MIIAFLCSHLPPRLPRKPAWRWQRPRRPAKKVRMLCVAQCANVRRCSDPRALGKGLNCRLVWLVRAVQLPCAVSHCCSLSVRLSLLSLFFSFLFSLSFLLAFFGSNYHTTTLLSLYRCVCSLAQGCPGQPAVCAQQQDPPRAHHSHEPGRGQRRAVHRLQGLLL